MQNWLMKIAKMPSESLGPRIRRIPREEIGRITDFAEKQDEERIYRDDIKKVRRWLGVR